jgi:hypothetical protein
VDVTQERRVVTRPALELGLVNPLAGVYFGSFHLGQGGATGLDLQRQFESTLVFPRFVRRR